MADLSVPPNNPISACVATSVPGYRSFPKWAMAVFVWSIITQMTMMTMSERLQIKEFDRKVVSFNQNFVYATISFNVEFKNDSTVV